LDTKSQYQYGDTLYILRLRSNNTAKSPSSTTPPTLPRNILIPTSNCRQSAISYHFSTLCRKSICALSVSSVILEIRYSTTRCAFVPHHTAIFPARQCAFTTSHGDNPTETSPFDYRWIRLCSRTAPKTLTTSPNLGYWRSCRVWITLHPSRNDTLGGRDSNGFFSNIGVVTGSC